MVKEEEVGDGIGNNNHEDGGGCDHDDFDYDDENDDNEAVGTAGASCYYSYQLSLLYNDETKNCGIADVGE